MKLHPNEFSHVDMFALSVTLIPVQLNRETERGNLMPKCDGFFST